MLSDRARRILTERQTEVLELWLVDKSRIEIAEALGISKWRVAGTIQEARKRLAGGPANWENLDVEQLDESKVKAWL